MDKQTVDILIIRYIEGDMNTAEKAAFEARLSTEVDLKNDLEAYKLIAEGVKLFGKNKMKTDLMLAQAAVVNSKSFKEYKPSIGGGSGFSFFGFTAKLFLFLGAVSAGLFYFDKLNYPEYIEEIQQKIEEIEIQIEQEMKPDTIWQTVKSTKMKSDTVYIKTQQQLDSFYNKIEKDEDEAVDWGL